jgi:hypothetical protein
MCKGLQMAIKQGGLKIMGQLVVLKINLSSVDKAHLFKGEKGIYLDVVLHLNDVPDQYGNHGMMTQGITKELRAAGVKGAILGNAKIVAETSPKPKPTPVTNEDLDGLPF